MGSLVQVDWGGMLEIVRALRMRVLNLELGEHRRGSALDIDAMWDAHSKGEQAEAVRLVHPNFVKRLVFSDLNWNFWHHLTTSKKVRARFESMKTLADRIWFVKSQIRVKTYLSQPLQPTSQALPPGLLIAHSTERERSLLAGARTDIHELFRYEKSLPKEKRLPHMDYLRDRGLYYIFGTDIRKATMQHTAEELKDPRNQPYVRFKDAYRLLHNRDCPHLAEFCMERAKSLCRLFELPFQALEDKCMLLLLRYLPKQGLWLHVDNVARTDGGPVCTISLGPPDVNVDFVPLLEPTAARQPLRINIDEGETLIMEGESRFDWAHGIPYGLNDDKYTVMFKFTVMPQYEAEDGYSDLLDTHFYSMKHVHAAQA
jgi:alkylated DNA repair dioxygenase AlkB